MTRKRVAFIRDAYAPKDLARDLQGMIMEAEDRGLELVSVFPHSNYNGATDSVFAVFRPRKRAAPKKTARKPR